MNKKNDNYDALLNKHIKNSLPFSENFRAEDLLFENPDGKGWILRIKNKIKYHIYFVKNFNAAWGLRTGNLHSKAKVLVIFDHVNVEQAEELRQHNIEFMDRRGNVFLQLPSLYLFVSGRKMRGASSVSLSAKCNVYTNKLFKIAGVKLIYVLLTDPELDTNSPEKLLNSTLRNLAELSGISLGSASGIFRKMEKQGYIVDDNGKRFLMNRKELFRNWMNGFLDYRPRWNVVYLEPSNANWWKDVKLDKLNIFWGGETAASILTKGFLVPEKTTLYANDIIYNFTLKHDLRKVTEGGNVELMAPLPGRPYPNNKACVHPLLVYAELIYSGKDRNREAADRIYDLYLKKIIEPN